MISLKNKATLQRQSATQRYLVLSVDPFRSNNILLSAFPDSKNVTFMDADRLDVINKSTILQHFLNFTYHASML